YGVHYLVYYYWMEILKVRVELKVWAGMKVRVEMNVHVEIQIVMDGGHFHLKQQKQQNSFQIVKMWDEMKVRVQELLSSEE
ncbi:tRNA N6-adenosine threonylcarbamoyltransferase, partial [Frankliniella fusca]